MTQVAPWVVYPAVLLLGIGAHLILQQQNGGLLVATYIPIVTAALLVMTLERIMPARKAWQPNIEDVKNDALFMVFIQLVLPRLLTIFFIVLLMEPIQDSGLAVTSLWPHHWSIGWQVLLMIVSAEFFRYWLHRLAHEKTFLWRFHAVHHAPKKLYWLNVGRFHIVDKSLQFLLDALPFMLLGVGEWVIGLYMVCYSVNGFFQHSNVHLKFGWLNYIISTAELHRWHHSKIPAESNRNYGNNLIIWDLVFGSWFLPKDREVGELGIKNPTYPQSFLKQLKMPFIGSSQDMSLPTLSLKDILTNGLIALGLWRIKHRLWKPLQRTLTNPALAQRRVFDRIVTQFRATSFGQQHNFSSIKSYDDFITQVPVQTYESLQPFIEAQEQGESALSTIDPIQFAQTSGTTAQPKMIPIFNHTVEQLQQQQSLFAYLQYQQVPTAFTGKLLGIVGAPSEGQRDSGMKVGSVSGLMYQSMPSVLKSKYVLPECVFDISDYDLKYLVIARLALAESAITYLNSANPTTFLKLIDVIQTHQTQLIEDIAQGQFHQVDRLPEPLQKQLLPFWKADAQRATDLKALARIHKQLTIEHIWPHLQLVATWVGGSCGIAIDRLKPQLPDSAHVMDIGYISTEFRGTVPYYCDDPGGIALINDHFYEFVPRALWEQGQQAFQTIDQLSVGEDYYVFITTSSGLVRYAMNDIVRVTGMLEQTPLLAFCQKGKGVTNITGEKLTEEQLLLAMKQVEQKLDAQATFYMMLADESERQYTLWLEIPRCSDALTTIADTVEQQLRSHNIEYDAKRGSGRLAAVKVRCLKSGTGEAYKKFMLGKGQRESQYKVLPLQYARDVSFNFSEYVQDK